MSAFDNEERALADALRAQATEAGLQSASFEAVRGRAGTIRRRRAVGAGVGLALAAAVLAPVALLMAGAPGSNEPLPAEDPTDTPSVTEEQSDEPTPQGDQVFTVDVAQGDAPRIAYIEGNVLHRPDGSAATLLEGRYIDLVTQGDRTFAVRSADGELVLHIFEGDVATASYPGTESVVASRDNSVVAWIDGDGEIWTYASNRPLSLGTVDKGSSAVAVLGSKICQEGTDGSGCIVYFNQPGESGPMLRDSRGRTQTLAPGLIGLADVAPDRLMGQLSYTDDSSCHELLDEGLRRMFKTCDHVLFQFSPGVDFISASPTSYLSGFGTDGLNILDARGRDVAFWSSAGQPQDTQDVLYSHTWEDDNHVLAISSGPNGWHVLRLGVDGSIEVALTGIKTDDPYADAPYVLESP